MQGVLLTLAKMIQQKYLGCRTDIVKHSVSKIIVYV